MKFKTYCVNENFLKFLEYRSKVSTLKEAVEFGNKDNVATSNFKNFNNKKNTNEILEIAKKTPELMSIIKVKDSNKSIMIVIENEISNEVTKSALNLVCLSILSSLGKKQSKFNNMKLFDSFAFHLTVLHSKDLSFFDLF